MDREAFQGVEMSGTIGQLTFEWYVDFLVFSIGIMSAGASSDVSEINHFSE